MVATSPPVRAEKTLDLVLGLLISGCAMHSGGIHPLSSNFVCAPSCNGF